MKSFRRLMEYCRPYWWRIALAAFGSVMVGSSDGALAYLVEPVLKRFLSGKDNGIVLMAPVGIVILYAVRGLCRFTNDYFIRTAGQLAVQDVRNNIYQKNMRLSIGFFNKQPTGALMSRIMNDVTMMQEGVANIITGLFRDCLSTVFLLGVIFYRNWELAIISFLVIPLSVYPAQKIGKKIKNLARQGQGKMGDISAILQETFSGIKVIKAFGLEQREVEKFKRSNLELYSFSRRNIKYEAISTPLMEFITSFGIAAVVYVGFKFVKQGTMTAPAFFSWCWSIRRSRG